MDRRCAGDLRHGKIAKGQDGTALPNPHWDTPTETSLVFSGITAAFGNDTRVMAELLASIKTVSRDADYAWTALYYLFDVLDHPQFFGDTFDCQTFANDVIANVRHHERHLRNLKRWAGRTDAEGCWASAAGLLESLRKHYASDPLKIA